MASRIEQIEEVINARIAVVSSDPLVAGDDRLVYKEILDVDVQPAAFPASTLLFTWPSQTAGALGGLITDNEWRWVQRSIWDASDPALAQREMKRMLPDLLRALATVDPEEELTFDDGIVYELAVEDAGDPNRQRTVDGLVLVKNLFITATSEEFGLMEES